MGDIRCLNVFAGGFVSSVHHGKAAKWQYSAEKEQFEFHKFSKFDFCCFDLDKSFSVSGDGDLLFGMNDHFKTRILVEDIERDRDKFELTGHSDIITALMLDRAGGLLFSAGKDRALIKWRVDGLESALAGETRVLKPESRIEKLHADDVFTLEPIGQFRFILSGGKDKTVKLVETASMSVLASVDAGLPVYGIVSHRTDCFYFGKNSKNVLKWDLRQHIEGPDVSESPARHPRKPAKKRSLNVKSCVVREGDLQIDRFFAKSTSLSQSKKPR